MFEKTFPELRSFKDPFYKLIADPNKLRNIDRPDIIHG